MPIISKEQALAIASGIYKDFTNSTVTRFTPISFQTLLNPSGINFTNNQIPSIGDPGNQVFTLIKASSVVADDYCFDDINYNYPTAFFHDNGFSNAANNTLVYASFNLKEFAQRVKSGFCNLSIIGDSLIKPGNNHLFQALYREWNPDAWRGFVSSGVSEGIQPHLFREWETHGETPFNFGGLGIYYPPSAPIPTYSTATTINTAQAPTLSSSLVAQRLLYQGSTISKFTAINRTNFTEATTTGRYYGAVTNGVFGGGSLLWQGYLKDSGTYFDDVDGRFLHAPGNLNTLASFTASATPVANALEFKLLLNVARKIETLDTVRVIVHNGTVATGENEASWAGFFVPLYFHQGKYGNNAITATINFQSFDEYSSNIVTVGTFSQKNTSVSANSPTSWYFLVDGADTDITLTNTTDADRHKIVFNPVIRIHNKLMTTGLQISVDGNAGYSAKQVSGNATPTSLFFSVDNLSPQADGDITVNTLAKRFEFEGTNTVMIMLGTNDAGDTATNVFNYLRNLYEKVKEAWGIACTKNPECSTNPLLVNFTLPFTTGTGTAATNSAMLSGLTELMTSFVATNPDCSFVSFDEILNRGFITGGTFTTSAGGYSPVNEQGWDLDITGGSTNYFYAGGDSIDTVHPTGISGTWGSAATNASCLLWKGYWKILTQAIAGNTASPVSLKPIEYVGGSLTSTTVRLGGLNFASIIQRDLNYHLTGRSLIRKKK